MRKILKVLVCSIISIIMVFGIVPNIQPLAYVQAAEIDSNVIISITTGQSIVVDRDDITVPLTISGTNASKVEGVEVRLYLQGKEDETSSYSTLLAEKSKDGKNYSFSLPDEYNSKCQIYFSAYYSEAGTTYYSDSIRINPYLFQIGMGVGSVYDNTLENNGNYRQNTFELDPIYVIAKNGYYFPTNYVQLVDDATSFLNSGVYVERQSYSTIIVYGYPSRLTAAQLPNLSAKTKPDKPSGLTDGPNRIVGTTTDMQYKLESDSEYQGCSNGVTIVDDLGKYYIRYSEGDTTLPSDDTEVIVDTEASYTMSTDKDEVNIATKHVNYGNMDSVSIKVKNTGNVPNGIYFINTNETDFTVDMDEETDFSVGEERTLSIKPKPNLSVGTYTTYIKMSTSEGVKKTITVSFKVIPELKATITPTKTSIIRGESIDINSQLSGGYIGEGLTYKWYVGNSTTPISTEAFLKGLRPTETTTYKLVVSDGEASKELTTTIEVIKPKHNIELKDDGNGSIAADYTVAEDGTLVTLKPVAKLGYDFKGYEVVKGSVVITNNTFIMPDEDVTIKAIYVKHEESTATITDTTNKTPEVTTAIDKTAVKTGDNIPITIMISILVLALVGFVVVMRKKCFK